MDEETTASSQRKRGPSSSYVVTARNGASVTRIREPHDNDVLSGRGGSINNHPGNKKFRDWVHERKNDYNLAANKAEKASVAREVIDLVKAQDPPGRFLTRDTNAPSIGPTWWVEISDNKANAKTSQALREGAPKIRADHKEELEERKRGGGGRHGSKRAAPVAAELEPRPEQEEESQRTFQSSVEWPEPAPAPAAYPEPSEPEASMPPPPVVAMSNEMAIEALRTAAEAAKHGLGVPTDNKRSAILFNQPMAHPTKRARIMEPPSSSENETPPLMPMSGDSDSAPYMSLSSLQKADKMKRAHSLALSDINDADLGEEFINPFEDESSDHPVNYLEGPPSDNHSVGHMSFSPLPKLSSSDLSRKSSIGNGNKSSPMHKTRSSRSVSCDEANANNCFCQCGKPVTSGEICPCGALADHLVWRDDHIEDEDWLHIPGFMDQIVPVSP
jgi:hypothetical protein